MNNNELGGFAWFSSQSRASSVAALPTVNRGVGVRDAEALESPVWWSV